MTEMSPHSKIFVLFKHSFIKASPTIHLFFSYFQQSWSKGSASSPNCNLAIILSLMLNKCMIIHFGSWQLPFEELCQELNYMLSFSMRSISTTAMMTPGNGSHFCLPLLIRTFYGCATSLLSRMHPSLNHCFISVTAEC